MRIIVINAVLFFILLAGSISSTFSEDFNSPDLTVLSAEEIAKKQALINNIKIKLDKLKNEIGKLPTNDPQQQVLERKQIQWSLEVIEYRIALKQSEINKNATESLKMEIQDLRQQHQELVRKELRYVKSEYNEHILNGKPDPHEKLAANKSLTAVAGPEGSNLYALVKIPTVDIKDHNKSRYRSIGQKSLFLGDDLQNSIRQIAASHGNKIIFEKNRNPILIQPDGRQVRLIWHHSPNHVGTVSLIPEDIHKKLKSRLHYGMHGRGGADMFSTIDPEKKASIEAAKESLRVKIALIKELESKIKTLKKATTDGNSEQQQRNQAKVQEMESRLWRLKAGASR